MFSSSNAACAECWSLPKESKASYQDIRSFYQLIIHNIINNRDFIFSSTICIIHHWLVKMTSHGRAPVQGLAFGNSHNPWSSLSVLAFCEPKIDGERMGTRVKPTAVVLAWGRVVWLWPGVRDQTMDLRKGVNHCAGVYQAPPMSWEAAAGQRWRSIGFGVQVAEVSHQVVHLLSAWSWAIHFTYAP